ncbi:hypothetical protein [Tenacibaculum aiptasiae]|uniref:hypothetical protein n=1 Tax=Tenacibaculum aiptasiae TaxID=426481 RepID=UPI00232EEE84|nr:hypothetical protein [Tenacibaculum aiptasiae]
MELIELKLKETTETHYIFDIKVKSFSLFKKYKIKTYECFRDIRFSQSKFIKNGKDLHCKWLEIDGSINAILSKKDKNYKKNSIDK